MTRSRIFSLLILSLLLTAFIAKNDPIDLLINSLQKHNESNPREKVHLHLDKPYYVQGDTLWFKAYVVTGSHNQLSAISGALYVDLINDRDSMIRSLKLPVTAGVTMGDFVLDEDIKAGNYRIRAYTQWMRNAGEEHFFDQTFMIGGITDLSDDPTSAPTATIPSDFLKSDIQFFPEGGNLVNGITSKMGFKTLDTNGLGLAIKGKVLDQDGTEISTFETLHAGMGSFNIRPESGKSYTAKITFENGTVKSLPLPKAAENGQVLAVYQPNADSILVRINTSNPGPTVGLIAQSGGEIIFSTKVTLTNQVNSVWLEKKAFPSGIAQFTVFDPQGQPTNERIAFIRVNDKMELNISTSKQQYNGREPVTVELRAKDASGKQTSGSFSVAVIDESKVPFDERMGHTIFTNLLLTADLKGHIEKPNYYFTSESAELNAALDNLMLTQGYRGFDWKTLGQQEVLKPKFPAEGLGIVFSGKVLSMNDKPLANANITMMSIQAKLMQDAVSDSAGRFRFNELVLTDSLQLTVQAKTQKKSTRVLLHMDSIPPIGPGKNKNRPEVNKKIQSSLKTYLDHSKKLDSLYEKTGQLHRVQRLKEVNIQGKKTDQKYAVQGMLRIPEGHSDQTLDMENVKPSATLDTYLQGKLGGSVRFMAYKPDPVGPEIMGYPHAKNELGVFIPMDIVLDGRKLDPNDAAGVFDNTTLEIADIGKIEVVRTNRALIAMLGKPSIMIFTKKDKLKKPQGLNMVNISPKGFNKVKTFYSPKYETNNDTSIPDLRSTIFWSPNIKTYATGHTSFNFFNADGPGKYKVIVEGINAKGELGRAVYSYEVKNESYEQTASDKISTALKDWAIAYPQEKIHLHTDKPYYLVGDTIWFKAYLANDQNQLSLRSPVVYADLINEADSIIQHLKLRAPGGSSAGQFILHDSLFREGNYRLRAYTQWMRNFDPDYFYDRTFSVGNSVTNKVLAKIDYLQSKEGEKVVVKARLTYTDETGRPLNGKAINYELRESYKTLRSGGGKTNELGQITVNLPHAKPGELQKSYLLTKIEASGDYKVQKTFPIKIALAETDLQFFPESGQLVNGISSKVAFKAIGTDGKGLAIQGTIVDSEGKELSKLQTKHLGMGFFSLKPESGKAYKANVMYEDGSTKEIKLPGAVNEGYILSAHSLANNKDSLEIRIMVSAGLLKNKTTLSLVGQTGKKVFFSKPLIADKAEILLNVPKKSFPSGITQFTLFSDTGNPLCERLVFIRHQEDPKINMENLDQKYGRKEKVNMDISVADSSGNALSGNFSIAVVSEAAAALDEDNENSIYAQLLLSSELKGYIENPNYYFHHHNQEKQENLDLLMLTHGYRKFTWQNVLSRAKLPLLFKPDVLQDEITGSLNGLNGTPAAAGSVTLINNKQGLILNTTTDKNGKFKFEELAIKDGMEFKIQGRTAKGGKNVQIVPDDPGTPDVTFNRNLPDLNANIPEMITAALDNAQKQDLILEKLGKLSRTQQLREVQIIASKKWDFSQRINENQADEVYRPDARRPCKSLMECLTEMDGSRVRFTQEMDGMLWQPSGKTIVVIDDVFIETQDYQDFLLDSVSDVEKIYIVRVSEAIKRKIIGPYMMRLIDLGITDGRKLPTVISIYTKSGNFRKKYDPSITYFKPKGYDLVKEFYSPKYNNPNLENLQQDLRSTVYWNPNLLITADEKCKVSYFNGDQTGRYRVTIEGIGTNGSILRKVFSYLVE